MKKGDFVQFKYNDYEKGELTLTGEYLGKGSFSTCFKVDSLVYSFVRTDKDHVDYSKEAISQWAEENPHIPEFKNVGDFKNGEVYTSPLYNELTKKNKQAWSQYKLIASLANKNLRYNKKGYNLFINREFIDSLKDVISDEIFNALHILNDAMSNYGDFYMMEFPKRNLKVNDEGNLILLDVFFNPKALKWYNRS